jgi:hypothetical protein
MDFCSKCGEPLTPGSKYCPKCGALSTTLPASFAPPIIAVKPEPEAAPESVPPPEITVDEPEPVDVTAPAADAPPSSAPATNPWSGTQDSIISTARYRKLNLGERLFTFFVVLLFASVVALVFTSAVAFVSTFVGDPFRVKPMLKGWGMDLWGEAPSFQFTSTPAPTPTQVVTAPVTATDPAVQVKPLPPTRTSVSFDSRGMGAREPSRSQARLFAALRPNMEAVNSAWDKVLSNKPDWPNCEIKVQMQLDSRGRAQSAQVVINRQVPKVVQDEILNAIQKTDFGRAANAVTTTITFRFGTRG